MNFLVLFLTVVQDLAQLVLSKKNVVATTMIIHGVASEFFAPKPNMKCVMKKKSSLCIHLCPSIPPPSLNCLVIVTFLIFPFPTSALTVKVIQRHKHPSNMHFY